MNAMALSTNPLHPRFGLSTTITTILTRKISYARRQPFSSHQIFLSHQKLLSYQEISSHNHIHQTRYIYCNHLYHHRHYKRSNRSNSTHTTTSPSYHPPNLTSTTIMATSTSTSASTSTATPNPTTTTTSLSSSSSSSPKPTSSKSNSPLSFMNRLSPSVSYFDAQDPNSNSSSSSAIINPDSNTNLSHRPTNPRDPELILVLSWMGARDAHISKYISQHRSLFPSSSILLVRCPATYVLWPPLAHKHLLPAVPLLKALAKPSSSAEKVGHPSILRQVPRVLVHAFSNGGMFSAVKMASLLRAATRGQDLILPRYVLIMDSCPGNFHWMRTHTAFMQSLPKWSSPLLHLALLFAWICYKLRLMYPAQNRNAELFREKALVPLEVRRTYLYGSADLVIDKKDIEEHAHDSEKTGFLVRRERFEGAGHVMNARADADRYWRVVRETWEGKVGTPRT